MFDKQAQLCSEVLDIRLTERELKKNRFPMTGIPHHAAEKYLCKLIRLGFKVNVTYQDKLSQPTDGVLSRDILEVHTPGTYFNEEENIIPSLLSIKSNNLSFDLTEYQADTGLIRSYTVDNWRELLKAVDKISPKEIVYDQVSSVNIMKALNLKIHPKDILSEYFNSTDSRPPPSIGFNFNLGRKRILLTEHKTSPLDIKTSYDLVQNYLERYLKSKFLVLDKSVVDIFSQKQTESYLRFDSNVSSVLDIFPRKQVMSSKPTSLFSFIDKTTLKIGKKELEKRLQYPLTCVETINKRLKSIEILKENQAIYAQFSKLINSFKDFHSLLKTRKNLSSIDTQNKESIEQFGRMVKLFLNDDFIKNFSSLTTFSLSNSEIGEVTQKFLSKLLKAKTELELAVLRIESVLEVCSEGRVIIKEGQNEKLDSLNSTFESTEKFLKIIKAKYKLPTDIKLVSSKLKKINGMIQVPKSNFDGSNFNNFMKMMKESDIKSENHLKDVYRFHTIETLQRLKVQEVQKRDIEEEEIRILKELYLSIEKNISFLDNIFKFLATIDVLKSLTTLVLDNPLLTKPTVTNSRNFSYVDGYHLLAEENSSSYRRNDVHLMNDKERSSPSAYLITGPNMGGKSTFLRQTAHILILAQIGCYVPCSKCELGVVDRIFCRIGADDDLMLNQSTFLKEMEEVAEISNSATKKSLVLVDEVGRGTAPKPGEAISQAFLEHLLKISCRSLFATHFHSLRNVKHKDLVFYKFSYLLNDDGTISYTYELSKGVEEESLAFHVAEVAGVEDEITRRAQDLLDK